jgi:hypothetical protein
VRVLLLAVLLVACPGVTEAQENPFRWRITAPSGRSAVMYGEGITIGPMVEVGTYKAELEVSYRHEHPPGQLWIATDTRYFPVFAEEPIFWDNFETGTASAWSTTNGG